MDYRGEFSIEVAVFLPHVYWLWARGLAPRVTTYQGMEPFYFFLDDGGLETRPGPRDYVRPEDRPVPRHLADDEALFRASGDPAPPQFAPPPLWERYGGWTAAKPLVVISNKFNYEWGDFPHNYLTMAELTAVVGAFPADAFSVVYCRSDDCHAPGYSRDHNEEVGLEVGDKAMLKRLFPHVTLLEDLVASSGQPYNLVKCIVCANAAVTVSTIGGFNYLNAYFPAKHIIFKKYVPSRVFCREFYQRMHDMLCPSPSAIAFCEQPDEFEAAVRAAAVQASTMPVPGT